MASNNYVQQLQELRHPSYRSPRRSGFRHFQRILKDGKSFEGDCAKQIQTMIDKRLLEGAKDASEGKTRSSTIDEQGRIINKGCQVKEKIFE